MLIAFIYIAIAAFVVTPIIGIVAGVCDAIEKKKFKERCSLD